MYLPLKLNEQDGYLIITDSNDEQWFKGLGKHLADVNAAEFLANAANSINYASAILKVDNREPGNICVALRDIVTPVLYQTRHRATIGSPWGKWEDYPMLGKANPLNEYRALGLIP